MPQDDFDLNSLANYLHLPLQQVTRLADRGKIPGRKVGGQWRFAQADIHHWVEERIGLSDEDELVQMETVLQRSAPPGEQDQISVADLLPLEAIAVPLAARTRNSVISSMVHLAAQTGWLWDPEKMIEAVRAREDMQPTALESGVALLHPRRPMASILGQAFLALGITCSPIPFGVGVPPADIFFLIGSVDDRGHLRALARLSRLLNQPGLLAGLRQSPDRVTARRLILEAERQL